MNSLAEVKTYIDSFSRPSGYNNHAWRAVKKLALHAWECYLENRSFSHSASFLCKEFYLMVRKPDGEYVIPRWKMKHFYDL
ncbi:MAG: hypothetical protein EA392_14420 [Cryomorphaceae bacterium]|nr:MAG: hypothetical protein EA392_14420 [Cryomorphaceae bacterium]